MIPLRLFFFLLSPHAGADYPPLPMGLPPFPPRCTPLQFAQRTGKKSCWARFQVSPNEVLCVSQSEWIKHLDLLQRTVHPSPLCTPSGSIARVVAPGVNDFQTTSPKKILYQQMASPSARMKTPSPIRLKLERILLRIERIREGLSSRWSTLDSYGIFRSLFLHEKVPDSPLTLLKKLGFVHLASVSGIHLYALASFWDPVFRFVFRSFQGPTQWGIRFSRLFCVSLGLLIAGLSGFRMGLIRPTLILLLRSLAAQLGFAWARGSPLGVALVLDLIFEMLILGFTAPHSGRMVYLLAVGGGLLWIRRWQNAHVSLAVGSWCAVALYDAWETSGFALFTPFISLLCLPFLCFLVFPIVALGILLQLLGAESLGMACYHGVQGGLHFFMQGMMRVAFLPGNLWIVPRSVLGMAAFCATAISFLSLLRLWSPALTRFVLLISTLTTITRLLLGAVLPTQIFPGWNSSLSLSPSSWLSPWKASPSTPAPPARAQAVYQLDVGQGDSALVLAHSPRTSAHEKGLGPWGENQWGGLIDTGSFHALSDERWIDLLSEHHLHEIDWIALSHLDEDHAGGVFRLARLLPIGCVVAPQPEQTTPRGKRLQALLQQMKIPLFSFPTDPSASTHPCLPYPSLQVSLPARSPKRKKVTRAPTSPLRPRANEHMGALLIPLKKGGFYLNAGDAPIASERQMLPWLKSKTSFQDSPRILKISHHGSKTSSDPLFLQAVNPTEAWISVGLGNRFHHPHSRVVERLKDLAIPIRRTDHQGWIKTP
ncbi:MAG: ComEC/Rec2 family competence protein [Bdellovibrionia bacterium]